MDPTTTDPMTMDPTTTDPTTMDSTTMDLKAIDPMTMDVQIQSALQTQHMLFVIELTICNYRTFPAHFDLVADELALCCALDIPHELI